MNLAEQKVVLVEDEFEIRELMALHLLRSGCKVIPFSAVEEALVYVKANPVDLVVLDWMLPKMSGVDFLDQIKLLKLNLSVLMVTARAEPQDIVFGLEKGADDYLVKPFDPTVFLARVKAILRRTQKKTETDSAEIINIDTLQMDLKSYEVSLENEKLHLTPSEFKLLHLMIQNHGRVLTRDFLIENIQGEGVSVIGRTIDTHVFGLRKKLGSWSDHIETIRGVGYRVKLELN